MTKIVFDNTTAFDPADVVAITVAEVTSSTAHLIVMLRGASHPIEMHDTPAKCHALANDILTGKARNGPALFVAPVPEPVKANDAVNTERPLSPAEQYAASRQGHDWRG